MSHTLYKKIPTFRPFVTASLVITILPHVTVGAQSDAEPKLQSGAASSPSSLQLAPPSPPRPSTQLSFLSPFHQHIMDKLVAQYSRPPHQNEFYNEQEQQDLTEGMPPLSLKFSLPPVDNVS